MVTAITYCYDKTLVTWYYIYIYIYAFSRRFYPKRLTVHSSYSFYIISALVTIVIYRHPLSETKRSLLHYWLVLH